MKISTKVEGWKRDTVPELKDVKDVACGENHTVVLAATSSSGGYTTYFFGDNRHGQASLDPGGCARVCPAYRSAHPGAPRPDGAPIQIHAGWSHTCVLSGNRTTNPLFRLHSRALCEISTFRCSIFSGKACRKGCFRERIQRRRILPARRFFHGRNRVCFRRCRLFMGKK